jgi:predicted Zn-dependent protease with MMP-like domain
VSTGSGHSQIRLVGVLGVLVVLSYLLLDVRGIAGASQRFPERNTSSSPNCSAQPLRPQSVPQVAVIGQSNSFPVVGSIDANGCDSWTYELGSSFGPHVSFFAGSGFQPGQHAFQYGSQETTELRDGHQLIRVVNPSHTWLQVYKGYDVCITTSGISSKSSTTCIAPAVERRPDDLVLYVPVAILLGALLLFVVHYLRPAGPIRRRRHYRRHHEKLAHALAGVDHSSIEGLNVKQLQKRLRRLEKFLSPELSSSQHYWFHGLVSSGRHGIALESLTRWLAESRLPVPDHIRDEVLWIASSLAIEREVRPVLDAQVLSHDEVVDSPVPINEGFDVPVEEFKQMVADAVDALPETFGLAMTNVAVVVEEEADGRKLFGLYQGHPLANYRLRQWSVHPDKITIYRRTICEYCRTRDEVRAQVYRTVIHEVAHHFGIDDPRLRELGW